MDPVGAILLLLLLTRRNPPLHLKATGRNQKASQRFISAVESMGQVVEMRDFDGKNIDLTWKPRDEFYRKTADGVPWYAHAVRDLSDSSPDLDVLFVKPLLN